LSLDDGCCTFFSEAIRSPLLALVNALGELGQLLELAYVSDVIKVVQARSVCCPPLDVFLLIAGHRL
jgi:hypothetical protein